MDNIVSESPRKDLDLTTRINKKTKLQGTERAENTTLSITDKVYESLWRDIIFGDLSPGQSLDEAALVERFSSSRTPIREALARLTGDGLVVQHRNRGAYVSEIRVSELAAFFEALHLMQRAVTRLAAQRWTESDLASIQEAANAYAKRAPDTDLRTALELDQSFHFRISEASRNQHLEKLYRKLLADQMRLLLIHARAHDWQDSELQEQLDHSVEEHHLLIDAITMRDASLAEYLAGEHTKILRKRVAGFTSGELNLSVGA